MPLSPLWPLMSIMCCVLCFWNIFQSLIYEGQLDLLLVAMLLCFKRCLYLWCKARKRDREEETEREVLLFFWFVSQSITQPGLVRAEAKNQDSHPGLTHGWQEPKQLEHLLSKKPDEKRSSWDLSQSLSDADTRSSGPSQLPHNADPVVITF